MLREKGDYVRGALLNAPIIGLEYALALALVAGLPVVVPIFGPIVAAIPALAVALLESPGKAPVVLAFYLGLQQLEGNIVPPS